VQGGAFDPDQKMMRQTGIQEFPWRNSVVLSDGTLGGVDWIRPQPSASNKKQQGEFTIIRLSPGSSFTVKSTVKQAYDLPEFIDTATLSPNGKILAAGTKDGSLFLWNLDSKELITTIRAHSKVIGMFGFYGAYFDLSFNEDGSHLATWGEDGKVKVFSMEGLSEVFVTNGEKPVFSPDGSHLAYIGSDDSIQLVSLFDEEAPKVFRGKNNPSQIVFSPDGALIFTGYWDDSIGMVQVWSITDGVLLLDIPQYDSVTSLIVSPDGTRLYIRTFDGVISAWGHKPAE
jgi:WD40 repeat protein